MYCPLISARPLATDSLGTSLITVAVDIDQKPPMAMPSSARPQPFGASVTVTPDTSNSRLKPRRTFLRSRWPVSGVLSRLASTAKNPETEIACPALRDRCQQADRHELPKAISTTTHSAIENTAPHAGGCEAVVGLSGLIRMHSCVTDLPVIKNSRHRLGQRH